MKRTKNYAPPMIISKSRVYSDTAILAGSVANQMTVSTVKTMQQPVENYDFGDPDSNFNHNWE